MCHKRADATRWQSYLENVGGDDEDSIGIFGCHAGGVLPVALRPQVVRVDGDKLTDDCAHGTILVHLIEWK